MRLVTALAVAFVTTFVASHVLSGCEEDTGCKDDFDCEQAFVCKVATETCEPFVCKVDNDCAAGLTCDDNECK